MSEQKPLARPRQVTTAGVMGVVGSALVVLSLFDALQRLRSVEMREAVDEFLAEPPGQGLGVSTGWAIDVLHGLVLFSGALAAVAAVLAIYVFQRHQAARIGFSIVAALLLITSPFSSGAMAMVVAFAAVMLWGQPARDWFAGREPAPVPSARAERRSERPDPWALPGGRTDSTEEPPRAPEQSGAPAQQQPPPAAYPFGSRPDPGWAPPAHDQQPGTPTWAAGTAQDPDRRPASVIVATAITWLFAGLTTFLFSIIVLMLMFGQDVLVEATRANAQFDEMNVSMDDLLAALWVASSIAIFWSLSAVILAVLAFRRVGWARIVLAVSAAITALVSISAQWAGLLMMVPATATVVLLFSRGANAWYSRKPRSFAPPPAGSGGGSAPQQPHPQPPQPPVW
ncbi:MAG: hypothetical protein ACXWDI_06395 [Nocardioides sp.]